MKLSVEVEIAKRIMSEAGLHGITIAPKKSPNKKDVFVGFVPVLILYFGRMFEKSILNTRRMLMSASIANAIGETTAITFVRDSFKINENINPRINIDVMTPNVIIQPNLIICFAVLLGSRV